MESLKKFQNYRLTFVEDGKLVLCEGEIIRDEVIFRFKGGMLDDSVDEEGHAVPAVESMDGNHVEHWKNGVLHCETSPAVVDNKDNVEEWYLEGVRVSPGGKQDG